MPVLKVLIITAVGSFLALDSINILGQSAKKQVNELVFYVHNPALVVFKDQNFNCRWFMPVNILLTFLIGSALGWVLMLIAKPPPHLKGLILGTCSADCLVIGTIAPMRKLLIGTTAPFRVIQDSASLLGEATVPVVTLIVGGNLLRGLKGSGISIPLVLGIAAVRYIFLPLFGILIVKGALHFGLVHADPLYLFVLLLQFALPPAMNIGMSSR
ncbi:hypothetical protein L1987_24286 [Smallanthus sonchifolius]|uniref:Uncharacterized protein n=1 Tax=Smallanthus sonchifolius TaxID=185202 RepID=A0ACB9IKL5_9ASTR|nr:hypothetical protein L1987_24286 [Smallanthus sonchifolius]